MGSIEVLTRQKYLNTICSTDDQVVLMQDKEDINFMIRKLRDYEKVFNKTEHLTIAKDDVKHFKIDENLQIRETPRTTGIYNVFVRCIPSKFQDLLIIHS